jgi:hypothetical protein
MFGDSIVVNLSNTVNLVIIPVTLKCWIMREKHHLPKAIFIVDFHFWQSKPLCHGNIDVG